MANPRIISGESKGLRLESVPGNITRPITDRVKEALFNIIGADIRDSYFLDLFAGTGSVGLEALSRGATFTKFVEVNSKAIKVLRKNIEKSKLAEKAGTYFGDAFQYIRTNPKCSFDYVFIAPPQYQNLWSEMTRKLNESTHILNDNAWIIVQIDPIEYETLDLERFNEFDQRKYGDTLLVFFFFEDIK